MRQAESKKARTHEQEKPVTHGASSKHGGRLRSLPFAFIEQGVAMLSGVLHSGHAIQVNVAIMRAFVSLRRLLSADESMTRRRNRDRLHVDR
jgi:hypothetical protein